MLWFTPAMPVASRESLQLKFDGPAVENHTIDVRTLAPSLLALADVCDMAHSRSGDVLGVAPALQVTATREGSFLVELFLVLQEANGTFKDVMSNEEASATANTIEIGALLVAAIKWTLWRRSKGREDQTLEVEPGRILVIWSDHSTLDVPYVAQSLVESSDFNRRAGYVFEPLRQEGLDEVSLSLDGAEEDDAGDDDPRSVRVGREDLPAFNITTDDDELVSDNVRLVNLRLRVVQFKQGNKWRVSDGASTFWASLTDLEFSQRVMANEEPMTPGDVLYVRLRDHQYRQPDGDFRMEHAIEKVMEHRRASPPDTLPFEEET